MTIKVRSVVTDKSTNETTYELTSPATISLGDKLTCLVAANDDGAQTVTPPTGWSLDEEIATDLVGGFGTRVMMWTKVAVQSDVDNQGTALYYDFVGWGNDVDIIYGIMSLYDDGSDDIGYVASSIDGTTQSAGGTTTEAPGQTITVDGSLVIMFYVAREGTTVWQITTGDQDYTVTGGANPLQRGDNSFTDMGVSYGTIEFDIADSPTSTVVLNHGNLPGDSAEWGITILFEISSSSVNTNIPVPMGPIR